MRSFLENMSPMKGRTDGDELTVNREKKIPPDYGDRLLRNRNVLN